MGAARTAVLVEGRSDQVAVETLARQHGVDLAGAGVAVVAIGGASGIGRALDHFGPGGLDLRLAGLCDVGEEPLFRYHLQRVGFGDELDRAAMERAGFFVCEADLEDELDPRHGSPPRRAGHRRARGAGFVPDDAAPARAAGTERRGAAPTVHGDPRWPQGPLRALLVEALDLDNVPAPLGGVLAHVLASAILTGAAEADCTHRDGHRVDQWLWAVRLLKTARWRRRRAGAGT